MSETNNAAPDLSDFENLDSSSFVVLRQNGDEMIIDGKPVEIIMHGIGTAEQVRAKHKLDHASMNATIGAFKGKQAKAAQMESARQEAEYLTGCTISLSNWPYEGGALALYKNPKLGYISVQAKAFVDDPANFMKGYTPQ